MLLRCNFNVELCATRHVGGLLYRKKDVFLFFFGVFRCVGHCCGVSPDQL